MRKARRTYTKRAATKRAIKVQQEEIVAVDDVQQEIVTDAAPPMSAILQDLTPEYIMWYHRNHSREEFYIKYVTRRFRFPEHLQHLFN